MNRLCLLFLFLVGMPVLGAAQSENLPALMKAVVEAQDRLAYEGEKTVISWSGQKTLATVVKVYHDGQRERLEYLASRSQPRRVVISNDANTYMLKPGSNVLREMRLQESASMEVDRLQLAFENYEWSVLGREKLIGHDTLVIKVSPKKRVGSYHRFWIDPEHKLILKKERFTPKGALSQSTQFTVLRFVDALSDDLFAVDLSSTGRRRPFASRKLAQAQLALYLPSGLKFPEELIHGYHLEGAFLETKPGEQRVRLAYTDGLDTISLFVDPLLESRSGRRGGGGTGQQPKILVRSGNAQWKVLSWQDGRLRYTLVGTHPLDLMKEMARTIVGPPREAAEKATGMKRFLHYFQKGYRRLFGDVSEKFTFCSWTDFHHFAILGG